MEAAVWLVTAALLLLGLLGYMGGRLAGATPSGVLGSGIGAVVGLLGGPFGMIAGAFLGAALAEVVVAKRPLDEAAKAGLGAGLGFLAGTAAKTMLAAFMVLAFLIDCFVF